jgi:hypothetical protein
MAERPRCRLVGDFVPARAGLLERLAQRPAPLLELVNRARDLARLQLDAQDVAEPEPSNLGRTRSRRTQTGAEYLIVDTVLLHGSARSVPAPGRH